MTEELPCGCIAEVWVPRAGAPTPPDGEQRMSTIKLSCEIHRHLLMKAVEE